MPRTAHFLRQIKHRAAVFAKHASWGFPQWRGPVMDPVYGLYQKMRPYAFPALKYADTWLGSSAHARDIAQGEPVPRRIFVIWSGTNEMSPARRAAISSLRELNPQMEVELITPETLPRWLVDGDPLPPAYEHLSLVHKSDVLRCYLLHHHGGGYSDVKLPREPWLPSFQDFEATPHWAASYTEVHRLNTPLVGGELQRDLRRVSRQLLGFGAFIARARTPLTTEWYDRVRAVLAEHEDTLAAHPGNERGDNPRYPLAWTEVLGHIGVPLTWKYQGHVVHDERLRPVLSGYL